MPSSASTKSEHTVELPVVPPAIKDLPPRVVPIPSSFALFLLCIVLVVLFAAVVYFYLESIGFMLIAIARASYPIKSDVHRLRKRNLKKCTEEIARLRALDPNLDWDSLVREGLCDAETIRLQEDYPHIHWPSIVCEEKIARLKAQYPSIDWQESICEDMTKWIKARYPFIDWEKVVRQELCETEIARLRGVNPQIDWDNLLCGRQIEALRQKYPWINWSSIACELRTERLRREHPTVDWNTVIRQEVSSSEIDRLKKANPEIAWDAIICEARFDWLRAQHPMINWDNILCQEKIQQLRGIYPAVDWDNVISEEIAEEEIQSIKERYSTIDWERIVRGPTIKRPSFFEISQPHTSILSQRVSYIPETTEAETSSLPVGSPEMREEQIQRLKLLHPDMDWSDDRKYKTSEVHSSFVKSGRPHSNWESATYGPIETCEETIRNLKILYPNVDWFNVVKNELSIIEISRLKIEHPFINWDNITRTRPQNDAANAPMSAEFQASRERASLVLQPNVFVDFAELISCLELLCPCVDWRCILIEKMLEREIHKLRSTYPCINWDHVVTLEVGKKTLVKDSTDAVCSIEINRLKTLYAHIDWAQILSNPLNDAEYERLESAHLYVNWDHVRKLLTDSSDKLPDNRVDALRQDFPFIKWDSVVEDTALPDDEVRRLETCYPHIDWRALIQRDQTQKRIRVVITTADEATRSMSISGPPTTAHKIPVALLDHLDILYPGVDWSILNIFHTANIKQEYPFIDWNTILGDSMVKAFVLELKSIAAPQRMSPDAKELLKTASMAPHSKTERPSVNQHLLSVPAVHHLSRKSSMHKKEIETLKRLHPHVDWGSVIEQEKPRKSSVPKSTRQLSTDTLKNFPSTVFLRETSVYKPTQNLAQHKRHLDQEIVRLRRQHPHVNWNYVVRKEARKKSEKSSSLSRLE